MPYGLIGRLPDFAEILQVIIVEDRPLFVVKMQNAWYHEHLQSFEVEYAGNIEILEHSQHTDL